MATFIFTFVILILVVLGASVGVLMGRSAIKGSCGGVGKALGEQEYTCPICGDDPDKCDDSKDVQSNSQAEALGQEVMK